MKNVKILVLGGAALGLALSLGACEQKKSDETPPSSVGTSQAPAPAPATPSSPTTEPDTGATGSAQGQQKSDDMSKSQKG